MENETLCQLAVSRIKGIGPVQTKNLIRHFGDASSIFNVTRSELRRTGLHQKLIDAITGFSDWPLLRQQFDRMQRRGIRMLFITDPDFPFRLLKVPTAPSLLFYQGTVAGLNTMKIIAIAGTRKPTEYSKKATAFLIGELGRPDVLILSGLALGVDTVAHRTALECHIPTIGVMGHGFNFIYPAHNRSLFREMRSDGGLLTSFPHLTKPDTYTFPLRNRLIAALCDALVIIETGNKGGSLSAAEAAFNLQRQIFALPGCITDTRNQGCLRLIQDQRALPLLSVDQLKAAIGIDRPTDRPTGRHSRQSALPFAPSQPIQLTSPPPSITPILTGTKPIPAHPIPTELNPIPTPLETRLIHLLTERQPLSFDDLVTGSHQPIPSISVALFNLEVRGIIRSLPGRRYQLAS